MGKTSGKDVAVIVILYAGIIAAMALLGIVNVTFIGGG